MTDLWTTHTYQGAFKVRCTFDPPRLDPIKRGLVIRSSPVMNADAPIWTWQDFEVIRHRVERLSGGRYETMTTKMELIPERHLSLSTVKSYFQSVMPAWFIDKNDWKVIPVNEATIPLMLELPFLLDEDRVELVRTLEWIRSLKTWVSFATEARLLAIPRVEGEDAPSHRAPAMISERVVHDEVPRHEWSRSQKVEFNLTGKRPSVERVESCIVPMTVLDQYQKYCPFQLYSQQLVGIHAILKCKRLSVWYDMRVGKTYTLMTAAKAALRTGKCRRIFIVCPVGNLYDPWVPTVESFDLRVGVLDGTAAEDQEILDDPEIEVVLLNYERVDSRLGIDDIEGCFLGLDETSAVKNPKAKRTKAILALCGAAEYVVPLNGTPLEQGPEDFWSQAMLTDKWGALWGRRFEDYYTHWLRLNKAGRVVACDDEAFQVRITETSLRCIRSEADQFSGQDSQFRYIALKATKEHVERSRDALIGVAEGFEGEGKDQMSVHVLACLTHLRQIASGSHKTQEGEGLPFLHRPVKVDPKVTWLRAHWLTTKEPLVIYCEFNQQEYRVKQLAAQLGIEWRGTQDAGRVVTRQRIKERIPSGVARKLLGEFQLRIPGGKAANTAAVTECMALGLELLKQQIGSGMPEVMVPAHLRYDLDGCDYLRRNAPQFLTEYEALEFDAYDPEKRAEQVRDFNEGRAPWFIFKTAQGRGISLNRLPAIKNGGAAPTIVHLSPSWSLGTWDQSNDRCVGVDPSTRKNICTPIYALSIAKSIDDKIMHALRSKKEVQSTLLADVERQGFRSFVTDLINDMDEARSGDLFDAEEIEDRLLLGIPPTARLTKKSILRWVAAYYGINQKDVDAYVMERPELDEAWGRVIGRCK